VTDAHTSAASDRAGTGGGAPLLSVRDLRVEFPILAGVLRRRVGTVKAVDGVSLEVGRGECVGLVGESGCGKTTLGRAILRLIEPTGGSVTFDGADVLAARGGALRRLRRRMQVVFQDPGGSLNPRMRVGEIIGEGIAVHRLVEGRSAVARRVGEVLERCGMPASAAERYPHQFSGGQRQRIAIARALALEPAFIVCDEPTSALDVSVQAQILNLLTDLRRDLGLSYLFISHDLAVVRHMCSRVAVMLGGRIVEEGACERVIARPEQAYTRRLVESVPRAVVRRGREMAAGGPKGGTA